MPDGTWFVWTAGDVVGAVACALILLAVAVGYTAIGIRSLWRRLRGGQ